MKAAVIKTGGKQYRVAEGDTLKLQKLAGKPGDSVEFPVLMLSGEQPKIGKPTVDGASVKGEIVAHGRGPKLVVFKFRRRKRYRRKNGHRQDFTSVKITQISG